MPSPDALSEQAASRRTGASDALRRLVGRLEEAPLGPLWLGLALWALYLLAGLAWSAAFGALDHLLDPAKPLGLSASARIQGVLGLLIVFIFTTRRRLIATAERSWAPLQPVTDLDPERFRRFVREETARAARGGIWVDLGGATLGVAVALLSNREQEYARLASWNASFLWGVAANGLLFAMMTRAARFHLLSRGYEHISERIVRVDLLRLEPLDCFGRHGLRLAFHWVGGSSIASLLAWQLDRVAPLLAILTLTLVLATHALLEPVRVVRHRIVEAKRAELAGVRARLQRARDALWSGAAAPELPALLAYERRVEEVREWPFDTSTLVRFGALALLAGGSWFGGAVVERLLDAALG